MIINQANLAGLFTGFKASFNTGRASIAPLHPQIATEVPSSTSEELYAWLGQIPNVREWIGDRVIHGIGTSDYRIKNKPFELTVAVPRTNIEDDTYGVYAPMMVEMGRATAEFPDRLLFDVIKDGFTAKGYDGQAFFSAAHPVLDAKGKERNVSNLQAGNAAPWFLLDLSRGLKPFIWQKRKSFEFVAKTDPRTSDHVFDRNEYVYGTDGRGNCGFGFWQMAIGSKAELNQANFRAARKSLAMMTGDHDRKLGIKATHIMVGPSNADAARDILSTERLANGASNPDFKAATIIETPWLD